MHTEHQAITPLIERGTMQVGATDDDKYTQDPGKGWRAVLFYSCIASWFCAYQLSFTSLGSVVWPSQISAILNDPTKEDLYNGFIPSPGAFVSLVTAPIAGVFSDYSQHRWGRRRVFIIVGSIVALALHFPMALFAKGSNSGDVYLLMLLISIYAFGCQLAGGPYCGLLPDVVKRDRIGLASGYMGAGLAVGVIIGSLGAGLLVDTHNFWPAYIFIAVSFTVFVIPTSFGVRENPRPPPTEPLSWKVFWRQFYLDPKIYKNFYWVILTRTLFDMGIYSILPFLQYYFKDILKSPNAALMSSIVLGILVLVSIPATLVSGKYSDKYGRKVMVYISTATMGVGCGALAIVSYFPSVAATFAISVVLGLGYGTYTAVDWALALDSIPEGASVAKDMGIWHLSIVLPQVIAPVIAGAILSSVKVYYTVPAAYCTLFCTIVGWFILAFAFVYPVKVHDKRFQSIDFIKH